MDAPSPALPAVVSGPVTKVQRERSLDVLRGVAVLCILFMNIQSFSMIEAAYANPTAYGDLSGGNFVVWLMGHLFFDQKFITIFTILFGAGIVLMAERREQAALPVTALHYRRMGWLMIFGLIHAYLLWFGDVLFMYAVLGMALYLCRHLSPWILVTLSVSLYLIGAGLTFLAALTMPFWPQGDTQDMLMSWSPTADFIQYELDTLRGSWLSQLPHRASVAFYLHAIGLPFYLFWRLSGGMLLGMALYKMNVLTARCTLRTYQLMFALGMLTGLPLIAAGAYLYFATGWTLRAGLFISLFNYFGSVLVSLGWIGGVMWICKIYSGATWLRPLAATGQMALTNYLMQTIICTTLFYGHGLGWFGYVERTGQLTIILIIWATQLIASTLWLRHFRFGPFEWLWRSLTYARLQPLSRAIVFVILLAA